MRIKDKITKQIFNVSSQSIIEQMLSNPKRYEEVKKGVENKTTPLTSDSIQNKENKE